MKSVDACPSRPVPDSSVRPLRAQIEKPLLALLTLRWQAINPESPQRVCYPTYCETSCYLDLVDPLLTQCLSDFQLAYAYSSFLEERSAWKAVIHLNLIRSVNAILDVLSKEMPRTTSQPQSPLNTPRNRSLSRPSTVRVRSSLSITQPSSTPPSAIHVRPSTSAGSRTSQPSEATLVEPNNDPDADDDPEDDDDDEIDSSAPPLTDRHRMLQLRLAPLRQIQRDLERSLGAASTEAPEFAGEAAPWTRLDDVLGTRGTREFSITSRSGWKKALKRVKAGYSSGRRTSLGSRDEARVETGSAEDAALRKQVGPCAII